MPERGFDTEFWTNPKIMKLKMEASHLYIYLWTNSHCNQAGLYYIALETIASESKIPIEAIPSLFELLKPKVIWYPEENLVWVRNFIKRQSKSPKFLAAAAKSLTTIHHNGAIKELLDYNLKRYGISIPYQYYIDKLSILTRASASVSSADLISSSGGEEVVKGKGEKPELTEKQAELLRMARSLKHWRTTDDDIEWLLRFQQEFPEFDRSDLTACADYHSGRIEAKHKGDWKNRLRNWMLKKREFERRDKGVQPKLKQARRRPLTYIRGAEEPGPEDTADMP